MSDTLIDRGPIVFAQYHDVGVPEYAGNLHIEALPPRPARDEVESLMAYYPPFDPAARTASAETREEMISAALSSVRHPLSIHLDLQARIWRLIRGGYVGRNPLYSRYEAALGELERRQAGTSQGYAQELAGAHTPRQEAMGLTLLGISGIGKTEIVRMCLRLFPQLILHSTYRGRAFTRTQVVWLRLQCPRDGSLVTLCNNFFAALDQVHEDLPSPTNYREDFMRGRTAIQRLISAMARLAAIHGLGVLVIDELQDLKSTGREAILSFLVQLANTMGIPIVYVGGINALPLMTQEFRQARRGSTEGDMILDRAKPGKEWRSLCDALWRYQYTRHEVPLTDDICDALYEQSQGITQYLVLLIKLAQVRVISLGIERLSAEAIRAISKDTLHTAGQTLRAIRENDRRVLDVRTDVEVPKGVDAVPFARPDRSPRVKTALGRKKPSTDSVELPALAAPAFPAGEGAERRGTLGTPPWLSDIVGNAAVDAIADPHAALVAAGLIRDEVWARTVGPDVIAALE